MYASNEQKPPAIFWARTLWVLASAALGLILDADFSAENILVRHHAYARAPILGCYDTYTRHRAGNESCTVASPCLWPWNCTIECMHPHTYVRARRRIIEYRSIDQIRRRPAATNRDWSIRFTMQYVVTSYICASVYATKLYIQPLNKKLLDLSSSPACMHPPINGCVGSSGTKKRTPILRRARRTWRCDEPAGGPKFSNDCTYS